MKEMEKTLESSMKIRFHDCDPFNHLNNSRYIDYIMAARTDQLEEYYGFDTTRIAQQQQVGWVSAQTQISYLVPALVSEVVTIQTRLIAFSEKSLLMEGLMLSRDKMILKSVLWAKLVHFNLGTQRSESHSEAFMQLFQQVVEPLSVEMNFEQRVKALRQEVSVAPQRF